jgi:predicted ATP-grasp superfamily ATP-dependent carboligase
LVRSNAEAIDVLEKAADFADAALVIAPETSGTLQYLVRRIEQQKDLLSLNSTANAIIEASDKTLLEEKAKKIGVETPKTIFFKADEDIENVAVSVQKTLGFPAVIKPSDGVGCEGLSIVYNKNQLLSSVKKTAKLKANFFIAQEFVRGKPASVTLISNGKTALPITLNKQNVSLRPPGRDSEYNGGIIPFDENGLQDQLSMPRRELWGQ